LAFPIATNNSSASRQTDGKSFVLEWQIVTVALRWSNMSANGLPTMLLRPNTTARFPSILTPVDSIILMTPFGVQASNTGCPSTSRPKLYG
jgi:hypothetical protein